MLRKTVWISLPALVLACGPDMSDASDDRGATSDPSQQSADPAPAAASPAQEAESLDGTRWLLVDLEGSEIVDGTQPTLSFTEGRASGSGGCNGFSGAYEQSGDELTFGMMATTRMACPEAQMAQDDRVFAFLSTVERFALSPEGHLVLIPLSDAATSRLVPIESEP